ncbi:MAG: SDR family NAD(P)-dependent oxidoreductase [Candidatus Firestonebacteria bacterium]|nr:SDR family NAD(P)-dependent oxidoreductase [Candidatus Firestonebacteria bacterium]
MPAKTPLAPPPRGAALITGVSSGLGKALALQLIQDGFWVLGTVRRKSDGGYLAKAGGLPLLFDVTDVRGLPALARRVKARLGNVPLKLLVNNAGTSVCAAWEHMSLEEVRDQFEVNFFGAVAFTQAFLPLLKAGKGRLALISSTAARLPVAFMGAYCASKFALEAYALTLRQELYLERIPVICLEPGPMQTRIFAGTRANLQRRHAPELARGVYDRFLQHSHLMEQGALTVAEAAEKMARLLQKKCPPLRAVVSKAPWFDLLVPRLPQRWLDYFIARLLQPGKPVSARADRR